MTYLEILVNRTVLVAEQAFNQPSRQHPGDPAAIMPRREGGFHGHDLIADQVAKAFKQSLVEAAAA